MKKTVKKYLAQGQAAPRLACNFPKVIIPKQTPIALAQRRMLSPSCRAKNASDGNSPSKHAMDVVKKKKSAVTRWIASDGEKMPKENDGDGGWKPGPSTTAVPTFKGPKCGPTDPRLKHDSPAHERESALITRTFRAFRRTSWFTP